MKPNPERSWRIELWGDRQNFRTINFTGTIDEALAAADEEDCEVDWPVHRIEVVVLPSRTSAT